MRLSRLVLLGLAAGVMSACDDDEVTFTTPPPLAQVRFINAAGGTGTVDISMIDQVEWSAKGVGLAYRGGTEYFPTEAKSRKIRVFPTSTSAPVTSTVLLEADVSLTAGSRVTLLLSGSPGALQFRVIDDNTTAPPSGQIGLRLVNVSAAPVDGYFVATPTTAISGTPQAANVGSFGASARFNRAVGAVAARVTDAGSTTVNASAAGPTAAAAPPGTPSFPAAGVTTAGTVLSAYYFPIGTGATTASVIWFVDRNPAD